MAASDEPDSEPLLLDSDSDELEIASADDDALSAADIVCDGLTDGERERERLLLRAKPASPASFDGIAMAGDAASARFKRPSCFRLPDGGDDDEMPSGTDDVDDELGCPLPVAASSRPRTVPPQYFLPLRFVELAPTGGATDGDVDDAPTRNRVGVGDDDLLRPLPARPTVAALPDA
jgi:hypothetical protein